MIKTVLAALCLAIAGRSCADARAGGAAHADLRQLSARLDLPLRPDGAVGKEVEKRTNGKVKVKTFPGGTLLAGQEHL